MKVAIVYNRDSKNVINLFGTPNQEKIGQKTIERISKALHEAGHQVTAMEGDKELVDRLEEFMPRVMKGERPGMVFNVSYGIQGQARYTHVPSILEMVGIPYVASGPLAHSLALDKVVSKMIFRQNGLPTPEFAVLTEPGFPDPGLPYPLIVKPKNEAVSYGLRVVNNLDELREGAGVIFDKFNQPVLAEQYIEGREINVGLLGNYPPEALPPAEIVFGKGGPQVYTYEDKTGKSGRKVEVACPAAISAKLTEKAQTLARDAFVALGCYDCARVDMRMDAKGNLYILEINSLPSLGEHGSYTHAAAAAGLDYAALVNRLVEVASARYFGTPTPPTIAPSKTDPDTRVFQYLTERRDDLERRLREWTRIHSRTSDPTGIQDAVQELDKKLRNLGLSPVADLTDERAAWAWQTKAGMEGGTLLVGHLDVPVESNMPGLTFRRDPEHLYGEGIGSSRGSLVMLESALEALRHVRKLRRTPVGVLYYTDEGRDARYSQQLIKAATGRAKNVLVLRPGNPSDRFIYQRRGQRKYRLTVEGAPRRLGQEARRVSVVRWANKKLEQMALLSSRKERLAISAIDVHTEAFPMLLPHRIRMTVLMSYLDNKKADAAETEMKRILGREGYSWNLDLVSDRPPMKDRRANERLAKRLLDVAGEWEIPLRRESSVWPTVAGLVPSSTGVICGIGPVANDLYTPHESIQRISLLQRTLLLAEFLLAQS